MNNRETTDQLAAWRGQIAELRRKISEALAAAEPEPVQDYEFATSS
jgi:hypothetical protein